MLYTKFTTVSTSNHHNAVYIFFFSSRRRHTRCSRDWSSDVCSSDLDLAMTAKLQMGVLEDTVDVQAEYRGQPYAMKTMPSTETTAEPKRIRIRSEEHTSELQSRLHLVCRLLLEKKKKLITDIPPRPRLRN